jgi:drug/metabolite transporter (DMT)-like permease
VEVETEQTVRRIQYTVLAFCLALLAGILAALVWVMVRAYAQADEQTRELLRGLTWTAAATLSLTLLALMWVMLRWARMKIKGPPKLPPTPYVDAWSEAGKRIHLDEDDLSPDRHDDES